MRYRLVAWALPTGLHVICREYGDDDEQTSMSVRFVDIPWSDLKADDLQHFLGCLYEEVASTTP